MKEHTIFLFFPTMRCQLACKYCHFKWINKNGGYEWSGYDKNHYIAEEISAVDLLNALAKFTPYHIEFSGGEPLMWHGFEDFVANIPDGSQWAITSNTLLSKTRTIDLTKCANWTASYHGEQKAKFIDNCIAIRSRMKNVAISQVVTKQNIDECIENANLFAALNFQPNLLRELNPGVSWEGSPEWDRLIALRSLNYNVVEDDIPPSYKFDRGYLCNGGHNYFAIMPDGMAYKCYSEAMHGHALAHVSELKPFRKPQNCHVDCLGCALDHRARIKKLEK